MSLTKNAIEYGFGLIFSPESLAPKFVCRAPVREALFVIGCFSGVAVLSLWPDIAETVNNTAWRVILIGLGVLVLFAFILLITSIEAAVTLWSIRRIGKTARFRTLLCLIIFLEFMFSLPSVITDLVGERSWEAWWLQFFLDLGLGIWFFLAFVRVLRFAYDLANSKAVNAALPAAALSGILLVASWSSPPSLHNAHRWQLAHGPGIQVYYPRGKPPPDQLLHEPRNIMERISRFWEVERVTDPVAVFLFPTDKAHEKVAPHRGLAGAAHLPKLAISLVYDEWHEMETTVIHELAHLLAYRRIASSLPALLNEGIATHTEASLHFKTETPRYGPYDNLSLLELSSDSNFSDGNVGLHYLHAAAFVRDIIAGYGIERFKEFCQQLSDRRETELFFGDDRGQFAETFQQTFRTSLQDWERTWKVRWKDTPRSDGASMAQDSEERPRFP